MAPLKQHVLFVEFLKYSLFTRSHFENKMYDKAFEDDAILAKTDRLNISEFHGIHLPLIVCCNPASSIRSRTNHELPCADWIEPGGLSAHGSYLLSRDSNPSPA